MANDWILGLGILLLFFKKKTEVLISGCLPYLIWRLLFHISKKVQVISYVGTFIFSSCFTSSSNFLGDAFSVILLVVSVRHEMARRQLLLCVAVTLLASSTCYQVKKKLRKKKLKKEHHSWHLHKAMFI